MRKLTHAALIAIGSVTGSMMFAGAIVTGCGSSSSGSGDDTSEDSGSLPDSTAPKPDTGADSGHDSSMSTVDSGTAADTGTVTEDTGTGTADTGTAADTGTGTADTGTADTGTSDASEAGTVVGEGGEDGGDAGDGAVEAEAGCVSSITAITDGGTAVLVTGFDTTGAAAGWSPVNPAAEAGVDGVVAYSSTVGRTCPGSIVLTVPFDQYAAPGVDIQYDYNNNAGHYPASWVGFTTLHYSVKVAFESGDGGLLGSEAGAPYYNTFTNDQNYAQWADFSSTSNNDQPPGFVGPTFADQGWHDVVLTLSDTNAPADAQVPSGASCQTGNACKINSELLIAAALPDGGPPAPTTTVLYIDDIWLE